MLTKHFLRLKIDNTRVHLKSALEGVISKLMGGRELAIVCAIPLGYAALAQLVTGNELCEMMLLWPLWTHFPGRCSHPKEDSGMAFL